MKLSVDAIMKIPFLLVCFALLSTDVKAQSTSSDANATVGKSDDAFSRATRVVERARSAYRKLGNFSVVSREKFGIIKADKGSSSTGYFSTGSWKAIKVFDSAHPGINAVPSLIRLCDGKELVESYHGQPVTKKSLAALKREGWKTEKFYGSSVGLNMVEMLTKSEDPLFLHTGSPPLFKDLGQGRVRLESRDSAPTPLGLSSTSSWLEFSREGFLEKVGISSIINQKPALNVEVTLSRPVPLPKPDAFNWKNLGAVANPNFSISPESEAVLKRTALFYGGLKSLSLKVETTSAPTKGKTQHYSETLRWQRSGLMRLENSRVGLAAATDGKRYFSHMDEGEHRWPQSSDPITEIMRGLMVGNTASETYSGGPLQEISEFLIGHEPIAAALPGYETMQAKLLPSENLNGVLCDIVSVHAILGGGDLPRLTFDTQFWFAHDNGRWLRTCASTPNIDRVMCIEDSRAVQQSFNVAFPASMFQLPVSKKTRRIIGR